MKTLFQNRQAAFVLLFLFWSTLCNALTGSYMSWYIVQGRDGAPWMLTVFVLISILSAMMANRTSGALLDKGHAPVTIIKVAIGLYLCANMLILIKPPFFILLSVNALLFGASNMVVSTMYTTGRNWAEQQGLDVARYNALLRSATSFGWMVGPPVSFSLVMIASPEIVFQVALLAGLIWILGLRLLAKVHTGGVASSREITASNEPGPNQRLIVALIICFLFSLAHGLAMHALPNFYTAEKGMPEFAAGLSFSVKTFMEIICILSVPLFLRHVPIRQLMAGIALLAVCAFLVLAQTETIPQLILGAALEGAYYGLFAATGLTLVQDFAHGKMGKVTAAYMNSLFTGSIVAGPAVGLIAQFASFQTSLEMAALTALLAFSAIVLWIVIDRNYAQSSI